MKVNAEQGSEITFDFYVNCETQIDEIIIEGKNNHLLKEYKNPDSALEEATRKYDQVFSLIMDEYNFEKINDKNYKKYQEVIDIVFDDKSYGLSNMYYYPMKEFFDIYENTDENIKIKNIVNNITRYKVEDKNYINDLLNLMSMDNPFVEDHIEQSESGIAEYNAIYDDSSNSDISAFTYAKIAAINIATRWALEPDIMFNYFDGADCTNFVSQIASGAGKDYINKGDVENGWWFNFAKKTESIPWKRADSFVKFWGTQLETSSFREFSGLVRDGDYISIDFGNDGKWDHCGFIVAWDNYEGTYTYKFPNSTSSIILKYHDFKIAQHSSNQLDWVSSNNINWEAAGPEAGSRGKYGLIRRSNFIEAKP